MDERQPPVLPLVRSYRTEHLQDEQTDRNDNRPGKRWVENQDSHPQAQCLKGMVANEPSPSVRVDEDGHERDDARQVAENRQNLVDGSR